jgi:hypothetical protein
MEISEKVQGYIGFIVFLIVAVGLLFVRWF